MTYRHPIRDGASPPVHTQWSRIRQRGGRRGAAVTELAICLPVLATLVFGSIQACNLIYLKHALTGAAYEGSLELAKPSATNASVIARIQQVLTARSVTSGTIEILPAGTDVNGALPGTPLTLSVTAAASPNISLSGFFPYSPDVRSSIVATR